MFSHGGLLAVLALLSSAANAISLPQLSPRQAAKVCGVKGYDRGNGNYDYDGSGKFSTYVTCSQRCLSQAKCLSFGISGKACLLFDRVLAGNFDADPGSSDIYWDRACVTASTTIAAPTTTTRAVATTSSTTRVVTTTSSTTRVMTTTSSTQATTSTWSTTPAAPTTTAATTSSTTSATVAATPVCSGQPVTIQMTSFNWFNSTHNLDCVARNYPAGSKVCWNYDKNVVCANNDPSCTCTDFCTTGTPSSAYQPLGYGPPDRINIAFDNSQGCSAQNAQSFRNNEIGEGHFDCGSAADIIGFYGSSEKDTGNTGSVYYNPYGQSCNGKQARYEASFPLLCTHDAGRNATCTAQLPVTLRLV